MPYIKKERRVELVDFKRLGVDVKSREIDDPGELNFVITTILCDYLNKYGLSYATINDIVGALECTKQEFYRRIAIPYEDEKKRENGDVY